MHGGLCRCMESTIGIRKRFIHTGKKNHCSTSTRRAQNGVLVFAPLFLFVSLFSTTAMIINFTASFTGRIEAKHMAKSKPSCHRTLLDYPLGDGALKVGNIFLITLCSLLIFDAPCGVHLCSTILLCKLHFPGLSCMNRL